MKKKILRILFVLCLISCSSNDDDSGQQEPNGNAHISLTVNGGGFNNHRAELYRDTINTGAGVIFGASDFANGASTNRLRFEIPAFMPEPLGTYDIGNYNDITEFYDARFSFMDEDYDSVDGQVVIDDFEFHENCAIWRGNLNINFLLNGEGTDLVNIQGVIDIPTFTCE
ncbi:hypothetical protein [Winogradskyella sp.]|uniref:hypothetical protein n=1 Tax=Winogradskyella sp. TaxID=1883156 RepID=UPI00262831B6|nr:hypothetical protein [Winogradskyella sp.]